MKVWRPAAVIFSALGAVLCVAGADCAQAAEFRSVAERAAVLYDAPSTKAKKLYVVSQYSPLEVVVSLDAWVKVRDSSGDLTWIERKFLASRRTVVVTVAQADVRQNADEKSGLVFQARQGVALDLVDSNEAGWIRVRHRDGQTGFLRLNQVWGL